MRVYYGLDLLLSKLSKAQVAESSMSGTGPILLVSAAQLGIRKERGTRDKPIQWLNKVARYWLDTGLLEKGKGR